LTNNIFLVLIISDLYINDIIDNMRIVVI